MKKHRLLTSSIRHVKTSYKRFLSLLCLAFLGVGFFAGIEATSPDMLKTLDTYYDQQNMYDLEITSAVGFTSNAKERLAMLDSVEHVEEIYQKDVVLRLNKQEKVVRFLNFSTTMNCPKLIEGTVPKTIEEILVEQAFLDGSELKIGDLVSVTEGELAHTQFKIVGVVESPYYFTSYRGTTSVGNGQVKYYVYAPIEAFEQDAYTALAVSVRGAKELLTSKDTYLKKIQEAQTEIESVKSIIQTQVFYEVPLGEVPDAVRITSREDLPAYSDFIDATENIAQIGTVFPIVFFAVAVLISLISMLRMIEEDRTQLGTLKALGFQNHQIMFRYLGYSFFATVLGGLLGMAFGFVVIPNIIWSIYQKGLFSISMFVFEFNFFYATVGLLIALLCICGATLFVAAKNLRLAPATLMREKAPKSGKRIFLEHISFLWKRLNFSNKITFRNLFRYKSRMLVTLIGISGSTALILTGFGLRDSIHDIAVFQYDHVFLYDRLLYLKEGSNLNELTEHLEQLKQVESFSLARMGTAELISEEDRKEVTFIVPDELNDFEKVIRLNDAKDKIKKLELEDQTLILSEKLADMLEVKVGDFVSFEDSDTKYRISGICENYIRDYVYMTKKTYEQWKGTSAPVAFIGTGTDTMNDQEKKGLDEALLREPAIASFLVTSDTYDVIDRMISSLDAVVIVLLISSAMLAFVIMYNLSNINISERNREIATLKVLGFYDKEVDSYITRESTILSVLSIGLGLFFGLYLCHYIISTCEPQYLLFARHINPISYVFSTLIVLVFVIVVNVLNHVYLKKIDMIESLKSRE